MSISRVAKLAKVSSSTVSRVINNHPRVAPETAEAVHKAMQTLGYTPSARRPGPKPSVRGRTGAATIAFFVFGASKNRATPAFEELLHGVSIGASQYGLNLVFSYIADAAHLPDRIVSERIDGILLHGAPPAPAVQEKIRKLPTVWLMGNRRRPDWGDQVMPDGYEIGHLAAKYLIDRGHKHLGFLDLDAEHWPFRMYGHAFKTTAQETGIKVEILEQNRQPVNEYWSGHSQSAVESLVQMYLDLTERPTGLFVADDMQVAMIQPALQRAGVEVAQGKVEIISCNNEAPYLMGLQPRPAEIDIRAEAVGRYGVEQLIWRLEHADVQERIITAVEPFIVSNADALKKGENAISAVA